MKIRIVYLTIIAFLALANLIAQESAESIEQLYLNSSIKMQIIKTEAESRDRDRKMIALEDLEKMIADGSSEDDSEQILIILSGLAGEGIIRVVREEGHIVNDFPEIRKDAAVLLGQLGTEEAAMALSNVLYTDYEPMVLNEAVLAISNIELEDTKERDLAIASAIYTQTAYGKDDSFAYSYLQAIENIVNREGNLQNLMLLEEVLKLSDARQGFNPAVRKRAATLLKTLQDL